MDKNLKASCRPATLGSGKYYKFQFGVTFSVNGNMSIV